jgi:hypothetical protein
VRIVLTLQEDAMPSDPDIYRAAHLMLQQYGDDAELAAQCADRMHERGDREETLTWFRIWRTIAAMCDRHPQAYHTGRSADANAMRSVT